MQLSFDGSEKNYYSLRTVAWSPDSKKLVAYHTRPGFDREIMYIDSSPADQLQPKHMTVHYAKPGDPVDIAFPVLFDVASRKGTEIDRTLFPNPYDITPPVWWKDSRAFTFEYNQRGHQAYKVIEVDAKTGNARALIDEETKTFFYYSNLGPGMSAGRKFRHDVNDGKEIIWASERDGWEHLYLYDGTTGKVKNQITKGDWLVRDVVWVDEAKRQIWFAAGGSVPGQDPYFTQYYRINFDGTGLTQAHRRRWYAHVSSSRRTTNTTSIPGSASIWRQLRSFAAVTTRRSCWTSTRETRARCSPPASVSLRSSLRRARRQDGHLGHHHQAVEL